MKKTALISTILLAIAMLVTTACDPTLNAEGGRKVKFTANSQVAPSTKTSSGAISGGYWTIDWQANDNICIYAPKDGNIAGEDVPFIDDLVCAKYKIIGVSRAGHVSNAKLENVGDNGLTWAGSGRATFYGAYPAGMTVTSNNHGQLRFAVSVPGGNGDATPGTQTGIPADAEAMVPTLPLTAIKTVDNGADVVLDFYPAFSTFEFELSSAEDEMTIYSLELVAQGRYEHMTGLYLYDMNPSGSSSPQTTSKSIKLSFGTAGIKVTPTRKANFILYTLPCDFTNPVLKIDCEVNGHRTPANAPKTLVLKKSSGDLTFPAGSRAYIKNLSIKSDFLRFESITLTSWKTVSGQTVTTVIPWEDGNVDPMISGDLPQTSQFHVTGEGVYNVYDRHMDPDDETANNAIKKYRQTWVIPNGRTATVSFKIIAPASGTYTVTPVNADGFTVTPSSITDVAYNGTTTVTFTVTANTTEAKTLHFITTVTSGGVTYNIDSETQLFDIRGYHYFTTVDPVQ